MDERIKEMLDDNIEKTEEEKAYEQAVLDFTERLIITELPKDSESEFTKYVKKENGIYCALGIINNTERTIQLLPNDFNAPYDMFTLWEIALKNCKDISFICKETSKPDENLYVIRSHCGRAIISCTSFWNDICKELNTLRLIVSLYNADNGVFIIASKIDSDDETDFKRYIHSSNLDSGGRISYVFVRDVGMLSEAALFSKD